MNSAVTEFMTALRVASDERVEARRSSSWMMRCMPVCAEPTIMSAPFKLDARSSKAGHEAGNSLFQNSRTSRPLWPWLAFQGWYPSFSLCRYENRDSDVLDWQSWAASSSRSWRRQSAKRNAETLTAMAESQPPHRSFHAVFAQYWAVYAYEGGGVNCAKPGIMFV